VSLLLSDVRVRRQSTPRALVACSRGLLLLALALASSLAALGQVRLDGKVRVEGGQVPGFGVMARVETGDGEIAAQSPVNSNGDFSFVGLNKQIYQLIVTAEGFETSQQAVDLTRGLTLVLVEVVLVPARKTKGQAADTARTDAQASKAARKEYEKGASALAARKLDQAQVHLEKAVSEYPCYARAQADLATVLGEAQKLADAEAAARKARECDPDYVYSYMVLGQMFNSEKRYADSEQVLQEGLRRSPGSWQFYYQLGVAHFGLGQYSKADEEYQRVLSLNSTPPAELHVKLADLYLKEKAYEKAYSHMEEYLKAEPAGRFATKIKNIMQQMQTSGVLHPAEATKQ